MWILHCVLFCVCLCLLSMMFVRFIHVVMGSSILFISIALCCILVHISLLDDIFHILPIFIVNGWTSGLFAVWSYS